jgi:hypothetical protein
MPPSWLLKWFFQYHPCRNEMLLLASTLLRE